MTIARYRAVGWVCGKRRSQGVSGPFAEACETRFDVFGGAGTTGMRTELPTVRRDLGLRVLFTIHFQACIWVLFSCLLQGEFSSQDQDWWTVVDGYQVEVGQVAIPSTGQNRRAQMLADCREVVIRWRRHVFCFCGAEHAQQMEDALQAREPAIRRRLDGGGPRS